MHIPYIKTIAGINEKAIRDEDPAELTKKLASAKMDVWLYYTYNCIEDFDKEWYTKCHLGYSGSSCL